MVWPHRKIFCHGEDNSAKYSEKNKKKRETEEKMGRQEQRIYRNGVLGFRRKTGKC